MFNYNNNISEHTALHWAGTTDDVELVKLIFQGIQLFTGLVLHMMLN